MQGCVLLQETILFLPMGVELVSAGLRRKLVTQGAEV